MERFFRILENNNFEVILVENGSTDDSSEVLSAELAKRKTEKIRIVSVQENRGYGFGILAGLHEARASVLSWTHADLQTDPADLARAFALFQKNQNSFVKGSRKNRPLRDTLFTLGMSLLASVILRMRLFDINAQPKLFSRMFFEEVREFAPHDLSLDLYFLAMARKKKMSIKTISVLFPDRIHGESKWAFSVASKKENILRTLRYIVQLRTQFS